MEEANENHWKAFNTIKIPGRQHGSNDYEYGSCLAYRYYYGLAFLLDIIQKKCSKLHYGYYVVSLVTGLIVFLSSPYTVSIWYSHRFDIAAHFYRRNGQLGPVRIMAGMVAYQKTKNLKFLSALPTNQFHNPLHYYCCRPISFHAAGQNKWH